MYIRQIYVGMWLNTGNAQQPLTEKHTTRMGALSCCRGPRKNSRGDKGGTEVACRGSAGSCTVRVPLSPAHRRRGRCRPPKNARPRVDPGSRGWPLAACRPLAGERGREGRCKGFWVLVPSHTGWYIHGLVHKVEACHPVEDGTSIGAALHCGAPHTASSSAAVKDGRS